MMKKVLIHIPSHDIMNLNTKKYVTHTKQNTHTKQTTLRSKMAQTSHKQTNTTRVIGNTCLACKSTQGIKTKRNIDDFTQHVVTPQFTATSTPVLY